MAQQRALAPGAEEAIRQFLREERRSTWRRWLVIAVTNLGILAGGYILILRQVRSVATSVAAQQLTEEVSSAKSRMSDRIRRLENEIDSDVASLRGRVDDGIQLIGEQRARLKGTAAQAEEALRETQQLAASAKKQIEGLEGSLQALAGQVDDMQSAVTGLQGEEGAKRLAVLRELARELPGEPALAQLAGHSAKLRELSRSVRSMQVKLSSGDFDELKCRRLTVSTASSKTRTVLSASAKSATLEIVNAAGHHVLALGTSNIGTGGFWLADSAGRKSVSCQALAEGGAVTLSDSRGYKLLEATAAGDRPSLRLWPASAPGRESQTPAVTIGLSDALCGLIEVRDPQGDRTYVRVSTVIGKEAGAVQLFEYRDSKMRSKMIEVGK